MTVYSNPENFLLEEPINAYVGGDAYNYIINANYATGFFVLAMICVILGCFFFLMSYLKKRDLEAAKLNIVEPHPTELLVEDTESNSEE